MGVSAVQPGLSKRSVLYAGVAAAVLIAVTAALLWLQQMHEQAQLRAALTTQSMARSLQLNVDGLIDMIDVALQGAADEVADQMPRADADRAAMSLEIDRHRQRVPHLAHLRATDERGNVVYGSGVAPPYRNIADRGYFQRLRDEPGAGLLVNKPVQGRVSGKWVWAFARRIERRDGSFAGVIYGSIEVAEVERMLAQIELGAGGSIALRDADLELIARQTFDKVNPIALGDKRLSVPFQAALKLNPQRGTYVSDATSVDTITRTYSYLRSTRHGFTVNVGLSSDIAYAEWRRQAWVAAALLAAFLGLTLAYARFVSRSWARQEDEIAQRRRTEKELRLAASVFTHTREGIMITDAKGAILDVNEAFVRITGYHRAEVLGRNPSLLGSGRQDEAYYVAMWRDLTGAGHWQGELWNRRKSGELYAQTMTVSAVRDMAGGVAQYVALFADITALKKQQQQLQQVAHYDPLTGLPNRVLKMDRLQQAMAQAQRRGKKLAVAYLDLDGFKALNERHGHEVADQVLVAVAAHMKQALRDGDTISRLGGDEFVAILPDLDDTSASLPLLQRLLDAAAQPLQLGALSLQISASVGVTFYPQRDEVDADQLLRQADQTMYQAKLAGKNRYLVFDAEQDSSIRSRHEGLEQIRCALAAREFVLYYQPKVNLRTGAVVGAEALIRWQHPQRGLLPPAAFLPLIEDHELAVDVGEWVMDQALTQIEQWRAQGLDTVVSVNVGARQLQQGDFVQRLRQILAAHPGVRAGAMELEVLETSALEDVLQVSAVIEDCHAIGVRFALDDFGTGYSSLTYLKRLPVFQLKIDQSFVRDMLDDPDDLAILEGVIGLGAAFRRQVIAEGVETVEHGAMLLQLGCELAQGYGIARPMPASDFPAWATNWVRPAAWVDLPANSRDAFPLILARVEYRSWILAIDAFLKGESATHPSLDAHECHLGGWIDSEGLARYQQRPEFVRLDLLHRQMHELAAQLCRLAVQGQAAQALGDLGELHALRDRLLEQLQVLLLDERQGAP